MTDISRRNLINLGAGAAVAGAATPSVVVHAAQKRSTTTGIQRFLVIEPGLRLGTEPDAPTITSSAIENGNIPIISFATVRDDTVYLSGVTAYPGHLGDVKDQTKQVLDKIDRLLHLSGTDKSKLLTAQVWLADMGDFTDHNTIWNSWVDTKNPPVRACVQSSKLAGPPELLVEIMATAAR